MPDVQYDLLSPQGKNVYRLLGKLIVSDLNPLDLTQRLRQITGNRGPVEHSNVRTQQIRSHIKVEHAGREPDRSNLACPIQQVTQARIATLVRSLAKPDEHLVRRYSDVAALQLPSRNCHSGLRAQRSWFHHALSSGHTSENQARTDYHGSITHVELIRQMWRGLNIDNLNSRGGECPDDASVLVHQQTHRRPAFGAVEAALSRVNGFSQGKVCRPNHGNHRKAIPLRIDTQYSGHAQRMGYRHLVVLLTHYQ